MSARPVAIKVFGDIVNAAGLRLAGAHAARPGHHGGVRPAQIDSVQASAYRGAAATRRRSEKQFTDWNCSSILGSGTLKRRAAGLFSF